MLYLALLLLALFVPQAAHAACDDTDWSGCAEQPWVDGEKMETPLGTKWWPHAIWGAGDEAGSTNWYKQPEVVLRALAQVKQGKTLKIGHTYEAAMPLYGTRTFALHIPGAPTGGPLGANRIVYHDEFLATQVGQVGTQFDGLGHIGVAVGDPADRASMRFYNGVPVSEMNTGDGLVKLGAEKLHPIVARGVLLDIARARGVETMESGQVITMGDVRGALAKQGLASFEFAPGDVVLFRTGWEKYWIKDNAKYNNGAPGIGMEVARWLAEEVKAGATGADTWPVDAVSGVDLPTEVPEGCVFCVHTFLQTRHGIVNQENLKLGELAAQKVWVFAYVYTPVPIKGATGSIGSPLAIY
jgi:kynurenine formamidase